MAYSKCFLVFILTVFLTIVTLLTVKPLFQTSKALLSPFTSNSTLGFGHIYVISLPHRTDRQDAMLLMALATGMDVNFIDGVDGKSIPDQVIPGNTIQGLGHSAGIAGCWRSHMNALRTFLQSGKETALIMEDDINWSYRLKESLSNIAHHINILESQRLGSQYTFDMKKPYTLTWDIIYLGSCLENIPTNDIASFFHDETVPSRENTTETYLAILDHSHVPRNHRLIIEAQAPACTYGYAVTRLGAQKILYHLGVERLGGPVDNAMAWMLEEGKMRGYSIIPPVIGDYKVSDNSKNSDIQKGEGEVTVRNWNIEDSVRDHIKERLSALSV